MNIMKGILIVTAIVSLFLLTGFYSDNKIEIKDTQNEEYKTVVIIAEQLLSEIKLKRADYKIVTIENMIISGDKFEGSHISTKTKLSLIFSGFFFCYFHFKKSYVAKAIRDF